MDYKIIKEIKSIASWVIPTGIIGVLIGWYIIRNDNLVFQQFSPQPKIETETKQKTTPLDEIYMAGSNEFKNRHYTASIEYFQKVKEMAPGTGRAVEAQFSIGRALYEKAHTQGPTKRDKIFNDAISAFGEVTRQTTLPNYVDDAFLYIGDCYSAMGNYRAAMEAYKQGRAVKDTDLEGVFAARTKGVEWRLK